jgi:tetratricopeptide (TPR) repeat protein
MANKHGADWALLLDTDERIICKQDIRKQLEESKADLFLAYSHDGQYTKERLIRIPAQGMFEGVAHETFLNTNRALIEGLTFTELPKSPELIKEKCLVVAECLSEDLKKNPVNFRNRSYLGATLIGLGKFEEAIEQFKQILDVPFDPEMSAGSHVYMASCYFELQKFQEALDTCLAGIKFQPIAELFFIAGYSYLMLGDLKKALCFAELAVAAGELRGYNPVLKRLGMRNTHMLYEWPFEIMIKVYEASGHKENAELFKSIRDDAKNKRLKKYSEEEINDANKNNARNSW